MIALVLGLAIAQQPDAVGIRTGAGTGFVVGQGNGAVGLFRPLTVGLDDRTELGTTGLISLLAPRVVAKRQLAANDQRALAVTASLGLPSGGIWAMRNAGILTTDPTVKTPFAVTASAGLEAGMRTKPLDLGVSVEGRFGVHGASWTLPEPGMWFLDPMLAPLTAGPVVKPKLVIDLAPEWNGRERLGLRVDSWVQLGGGGPDAAVRMMGTWAITQRVALALGDAMAWERRPGRSFYAVPVGDVQVRW